MNMTKTVILTVGLPRSGKSTWAKSQHKPIINRDSIRLALYNQPYIQEMEDFVSFLEEKMVESLFLAGHKEVIIDATHMKQKYSDRWAEKYNVFCRYFYTDIDTCKERAIKTNTEYLIPVINRMWDECDIKNFKEKLIIEQYKINKDYKCRRVNLNL